ncbi:MAG: OmpA family protein [bacterium]|nr:OmpA family protein [bacterium]
MYMWKTGTSMALAFSFLFTIAASGNAEDRYKHRIELGAQIGGLEVEGDSKMDTPSIFSGGRAGYYLMNELEVEVAVLSGKGDIKDNNRNANLLLPTAEVQYYLFGNSRLRPFIAAGIGVLAEKGPSPANTTNVTIPLGGGVKWLLNDTLALRTDARWIVDTEGGEETSKFSYTGGISLLFGGPDKKQFKKVKVQPEKIRVMPDVASALERDKQAEVDLKVEFDFDKSNIKPQYEPLLHDFSIFMEQNPGAVAEIEGHTDNIGTKLYNKKLSMRRAKAVHKYLTEQKGVLPSRLTAKGYGLTRPIAPNDTSEGRARNRRVIGALRMVD